MEATRSPSSPLRVLPSFVKTAASEFCLSFVCLSLRKERRKNVSINFRFVLCAEKVFYL